MPGASAKLHGSLEEGELVCPRREAAVSAVGVQLAQDGDERVVCRVHREVVEVARTAADADRRADGERPRSGRRAAAARAGARPLLRAWVLCRRAPRSQSRDSPSSACPTSPSAETDIDGWERIASGAMRLTLGVGRTTRNGCHGASRGNGDPDRPVCCIRGNGELGGQPFAALAGIGERSTRSAHRGVADQLSALLGRGREPRRLSSIVGEQALSDDRDRRAGEQRFGDAARESSSLPNTATSASSAALSARSSSSSPRQCEKRGAAA